MDDLLNPVTFNPIGSVHKDRTVFFSIPKTSTPRTPCVKAGFLIITYK